MSFEPVMPDPATGGCQIETITVWLNAFIPRDCEGAVVAPGRGEHGGKTMLGSPGPVDAWFLTDQRGFDSRTDAHSRMHSWAEVDAETMRIIRQRHRCDETIQVDAETGEQLCREIPDNSDMAFEETEVNAEMRQASIKLSGSTRNPCLKVANVKVSPNLDYSGTLTIALDAGRTKGAVTFDGRVETYPAFEMYVSINGQPPVTLFQVDVAEGSTPLNLVGPALRDLKETIRVSC